MNDALQRLSRSDKPLANAVELADGVRRLLETDAPRLRRLWGYYRNPLRLSGVSDNAPAERPYRQAQEWGLPPRITGEISGREPFESSAATGVLRKEVVIENDIAWRIDTMVDYLFGRPIVINSTAADPTRRDQIETLLRHVIAGHGGVLFLQQLALTGAVYGTADVLVKFVAENIHKADTAPACDTHALGGPAQQAPTQRNPAADVPPSAQAGPVAGTSSSPTKTPTTDDVRADHSPHEVAAAGSALEADLVVSPVTGPSHPSPDALARLARMIRLEIVDPQRALPLLSPDDCTCASAFAQVYFVDSKCNRKSRGDQSGWLDRVIGSVFGASGVVDFTRQQTLVIELQTADAWQRYEDGKLVAEGQCSLGRLSLVHVQNTPDPSGYDGQSDLEPLIPLQDELNTRLSDRAYRITLQSLRMYLGKNIEDFAELPIAPGQMWASDNPDAEIVQLGGDAACPSEDAHVSELREALDKTSGVSPIAAGAIKGRVGRLTSAAALRVTMMSLLSRTERKRTVYGLAIGRICELALAWLDHAGLFKTTEAERQIVIHWPSPIPVNETERLEEARLKQSLGVARETVLRELGYGA